ncbi:MAG: hypothetical protein QOK29_4648 [Rhodospirillaceae bacterium]|jgi:hypothetical protein|nr:hypothetical protein [Rhodospirillaceae bacterium]
MDDGKGQPPGAPRHDPRREPTYRFIRWLMAADMLIGLLLVIFGQELFGTNSIRYAGAILAAIGAALFLFFGRLAGRAGR